MDHDGIVERGHSIQDHLARSDRTTTTSEPTSGEVVTGPIGGTH
jgi:hypothetical protein